MPMIETAVYTKLSTDGRSFIDTDMYEIRETTRDMAD